MYLRAKPKCFRSVDRNASTKGKAPENVNLLVGSAYQAIHKVLFDQKNSLDSNALRGRRIDPRKLSGIPAGNFSVFERKEMQQDIHAAACLITDASGSMDCIEDDHGVTAMTHANAATLALTKALVRATVPTEVMYFGCQTPDDGYNGVYVAKSYSEPVIVDRFGVKSSGSTPTGEAIMLAAMRMVLRPEQKKIIFL